MTSPFAGITRLRDLAEPVAAAWSARARASTTAGRERAVLRAFGVGGLDRAGRPLAGAVVDRWLASPESGLGGGIALPFALACLEYDQGPLELATDVAAGAIDLGLEAKLLAEPDRRAAAELEVIRLGRAALDRIDANRTARRELLDLLGDAPRPWLGTTIVEPSVRAARAEAAALVRAGADLIRVAVPTGRELATRLLDLGLEPPAAGSGSPPLSEDDPVAAPAGSQRGLAVLRAAFDELAAERRAYVRLATTAPALSAPEQAVVAAFERVDVVEADAFGEIVEAGVDPDRALADHAFAHRLHARSGTTLILGAGPLVVGPDLARGIPPDPTTLAGRALALQLLAVLIATDDGLRPADVLVGATPDWLLDETDAAARGLADIAVRRALLPEYAMAFAAPSPRQGADRARVPARWASIVAAALPLAGPAALVVRSGPIERFGAVGAEHRAVAEVASAVAAGLRPGPANLEGAAAAHAEGMLAAAAATLERLADRGWRAILGDRLDSAPRGLGADAVAERTEAIDPLA
jgi:hypothetical protein